MQRWVRTEMAARDERAVARARHPGPRSPGRRCPDAPGVASCDCEDVPPLEALEDWVARTAR